MPGVACRVCLTACNIVLVSYELVYKQKNPTRSICLILHVSVVCVPRVRRDQLRRHYNLGNYFLDVDLDDLIAYSDALVSL